MKWIIVSYPSIDGLAYLGVLGPIFELMGIGTRVIIGQVEQFYRVVSDGCDGLFADHPEPHYTRMDVGHVVEVSHLL